MIFISRRAFEDEIFNRLNEQNFKGRVEDELYRMKNEVAELRCRVDALEQMTRQPLASPSATQVYKAAPYWTNPMWKAPDVTCTTADTKENGGGV